MLRLVRLGLALVLSVCLAATTLPASAQTAGTVDFFLPYPAGVEAWMTQGPGGTDSHSDAFNRHAYDFVIPGKVVVASAPGTVVRAIDNVLGQGGPANGNHVYLGHADGTCTGYFHLAPGSVLVASGDRVLQGQRLGTQGNTGSTFPIGDGNHLHFARHECDAATGIIRPSIPVDFVEDSFVSQNAPVDAANVCDGRLVTINMNTNGANGVGTSGDDVIIGTPAADMIDGRGGDDVICGRAGADVILGGAGNDRLFGEDGADVIRGNEGSDMLSGGFGGDRLLGGIDADTLLGGRGDDYLGGFGGADTIDGGPGDEIIFGGFGADRIDGGSGDDTIYGLVGNDTILGGDGNDMLFGDRGNDAINGGFGDDVIQGGNANDVLDGGEGLDSVNGGRGDDRLSGGGGFNDTCVGNKQINGDIADSTCERIFGVP
jgi:Ca2+-binding RTX toxin-like protein